jgi:hypothetical protein
MKKKSSLSKGILIACAVWLFLLLIKISPIYPDDYYDCDWISYFCPPFELCTGPDQIYCPEIPECRTLCKAVCTVEGWKDWLYCDPQP